MPKVKKPRSRQNDKAISKKRSVEAPEAPVIPKDQRRKQRHDAWLEKLDARYAQKKRSKKQLNTDLSDFNDILDSIHAGTVASDNDPKKRLPVVPSNKLQRNKSKKRAEMQEIVRMQKVMNLSAFQQSPLAAIRQHVQNTFGSSS
ncbi:hypothetical protein RO3G_04628 [Lichtheimia corymbifera JMRC:FSU:9682]|uniref:Ribosome biogenesis protein SLX9 n=1 Tax=Lichtheimia corymbifera JMRC:FSU:9682 TaxID=1263082 RepID=A0A068RYS0_9FUNG|nr:hypothetical protein RO3G_04628 [Lichtheimia corymbifera JMRC:FSU:9682]